MQYDYSLYKKGCSDAPMPTREDEGTGGVMPLHAKPAHHDRWQHRGPGEGHSHEPGSRRLHLGLLASGLRDRKVLL